MYVTAVCWNLARVHACAWGVRQRWDVEGVGHQVLFSIHQVLQLLLSQQALKELAVVGARQLHGVVALSRGKIKKKKCCRSENVIFKAN